MSCGRGKDVSEETLPARLDARIAEDTPPLAFPNGCHVAGLPTTAGSKLLADNVAVESSFTTQRLAEAGMIVLGKTITVEFARGIIGINHIQGTPHNPWSPVAHIPGGSSAGSAVAVAAGMAPMGLGSDTGGSVRAPAGLCATVGLKTTVGRISRHGGLRRLPAVSRIARLHLGPSPLRLGDHLMSMQGVERKLAAGKK